MKVLAFRNKVQVALFECELQGQISDGNWENTRPYDHYKDWCHNIHVCISPNVGRNFWAQKSNYNFTASFFFTIPCITQRMLNVCNMVENGVDIKIADEFDDYYEWLDNKNINWTEKYWAEKKASFEKSFGSYTNYKRLCLGSYDVKKMKAELNDMKSIIRIFNSK